MRVYSGRGKGRHIGLPLHTVSLSYRKIRVSNEPRCINSNPHRRGRPMCLPNPVRSPPTRTRTVGADLCVCPTPSDRREFEGRTQNVPPPPINLASLFHIHFSRTSSLIGNASISSTNSECAHPITQSAQPTHRICLVMVKSPCTRKAKVNDDFTPSRILEQGRQTPICRVAIRGISASAGHPGADHRARIGRREVWQPLRQSLRGRTRATSGCDRGESAAALYGAGDPADWEGFDEALEEWRGHK